MVDPVNDLPLINIFFHASESALLDGFEEEMGDNLYVFNKSLLSSDSDMELPSTQIDDASSDNLKKYRTFSNAIIEENSAKLDALCHLLVSHYQSKSERADERFSDKARKFYGLFTGKKS